MNITKLLPTSFEEVFFYWLVFFVVLFFWRYVVRSRCCRNKGTKRLQSSAVIISGCDYGFGREIALHLHNMGATVYAGVLSKQSGDKLIALATRSDHDAAHAGRLRPIVMDITKQDDIDKALKIVKEGELPLQACVNNAGISAFGWAEELPTSTYERNMNVNFLGTVRMTKAFLPLLRESKGRLINMGSIGARMPSSFGSAYLSTKAAMTSFNDCVRQEVHRFGVSVCLIEPGFFATELLLNGARAGLSQKVKNGDTNVYPQYEKKMKETKKPIEWMEWLNGSLDRVTDCVVDGIVNRYPLARYTIGYDARLIRHILSYTPAYIVDIIQTAQD